MSIAHFIDHTLLNAEAQPKEIDVLCGEAVHYGFFSVCVPPIYVARARDVLRGEAVKVCSVLAFPLGYALDKSQEALSLLKNGAVEIDMVINRAWAASGQWQCVEDEISQVVRVVHDYGALLKVIIESAALSDAQIVLACKAAQAAGADFVKTSTGFFISGASLEAVALMRKTVGNTMGVKASGGIRDLATAQAMIAAGANRLGCSASVAIVKEEGVENKIGY